jgi:hypothetical protein
MPGPNRHSRHRFTSAQTDADGRLFLSDRAKFGFVERADTRQHVVKTGDTIFNLAGRYYAAMPRAAGFWWVIADFNDIHDPTLRLTEGTLLAIPSLRVLQEEILNERRRREET